MINSIGMGGSMPTPLHREQELTDEQQTLIEETLSLFERDNLSEADAEHIVETFSEAGISPGPALEKAVSDMGFNAREIGELAGIPEKGTPPPLPQPQNPEKMSSMVDYLTQLMEEKFAENNAPILSEEDKQTILQQVFEKFNLDEGKSIIDTTA